MSLLLDTPRNAGAVAAAADALLAECAAFDLNDLSIPELDAELAIADRVASFFRGRRVVLAARRAALVEAGRPQPKPGAEQGPGAGPKPEKPLPAPGKSRGEQERDEAAARAVRWAPSFGAALQAGEVSMDHVVALGRVRNHRCVPAHESVLLCVAKMRTAEDFARHLLKWDAARTAEADAAAGADAAAARAAAVRAKRRVGFCADRDDPIGLRNLFASLPVDDAITVENTLRQIANELFHGSGDDGTTLTQRMADALVLMAHRAVHGGPTAKPNRPTLVVICDEQSLRGDLDTAGIGYTLDGHPVPAAELRRLACGADILPAVMNGAGQVLDWGRTHRLATDHQRLALLAMYGGCVIDGCNCPTELVDIHHLTGFDAGGRTDLTNLAPLCKRDHTRSHTERWTYTRGPHGHLVITTPTGHVIPTRRPRRPDKQTKPPRATRRTSGEPPPSPPPEQPSADPRYGAPPERPRTAKRRTAKRRTAKRRTAKRRTANRRTAKRRTANRRTANRRTAKRRTAKRRTHHLTRCSTPHEHPFAALRPPYDAR